MHPEIVRLFGKVPIHGYGLMIVVGFLLALWVGGREIRRRGLPDRFGDFAMVLLLSGIVGGRIFYYVEFYPTHFAGQSFLEIFKIWKGGLVFYGGGIGGLAGGLLFLRHQRLPVPDYLDAASLVAPIGMGFGRIGCFLNGCCWGRMCSADFPLGVRFPAGSPAWTQQSDLGLVGGAGDALPVHPTQLYQSVHDLLLALLFFLYFRWGHPPRGSGMSLLLVTYGVGRFFLEGLRGDNAITVTGLTISQNISLLFVAVFGPVLLAQHVLARRSRGRKGSGDGGSGGGKKGGESD